MRLRNYTKCILSMLSIGCISLVFINFAFKNNSHKTVEDKTSRIIIESPKKSNVPDTKKAVNGKGTSITVPSTYGNPASPIQPLPIPDPNASIVITPL